MVALVIAVPVLTFAAGVWYGRRRCHEAARAEYAEHYRVAIAEQRLREYHRLNAEHKAYRKIDLTARPVFEGETMKVSMN
jgi:hypothetical protein